MDWLSLIVSIMTLLVPAFVIYIARVGNFRTEKNEGKCFLVVLLICVYFGYRESFQLSAWLGSSNIWHIIIKHLIIGVILGFACKYAAKLTNKIAADMKQSKQEMQLENALEQNDWEFPCLEFYDLCKKTGVPQPDGSEFNNMKLQKAVEYILEKHNVPSGYWDRFLENGAQYYRQAEAEREAQAKKAAEEKHRHDTTLRTYTPDDGEKQILAGIHSLRKLHGLEKKRAMLKNEIAALQQRKAQALAELSGASKPVTAQWQKEKSWAAWGGIADAIAGPAAGVMTALQVQQDNQRIREQNIAMLEAASYLEGVRRKQAESIQKRVDHLVEEIRKLEDILDKLTLKVVLPTPGTKDIASGTTLKNGQFVQTESGVLQVSADVKCLVPKEMLPAANMVVDGAIHGKVFLQDQFVEDIYFILPRDGIRIDGQSVNVHSLCTRALPVKAEYRLELGDDSNLWVMEK